MRAPADAEIFAPMFPGKLPWANVASLRMDKQKGRPVLVEFWDFCRVNSLRTLPYVQAWHARYADAGLRVIGIHTGGYPCSRDEDAVRAAVERLGISYAVGIDSELQVWDAYGNAGWPARYLWDRELKLHSLHYGEGAYAETEQEICEMLGVPFSEPVPPVRPEDAPGVLLPPQTEDQVGPYSGPYEAGGIWIVADGAGVVRVNGRAVEVERAGCFAVLEHPVHTVGALELEVGEGVEVLATCFTPGVAGG